MVVVDLGTRHVDPLLAAGATAVQLGSVLFRDPSAASRVVDELASELDRHGLKSAADAVGLAHQDPQGNGGS